MKILFIITELNEGGAENALGQIASGLALSGNDIRVVCLYGGDGDVAKRLQSADIPVNCLDVENTWHVARLFRLNSIISEFQPEIIHSWLFHANFLSRFFVPKTIPLICSLRVVEPRLSHILLDRWTQCLVRMNLCVSREVSEFAHIKLLVSLKKCVVIKNAVDFAFFICSVTFILWYRVF